MEVRTLAQGLLFTTTLIQGSAAAGTAFIYNVESADGGYPILVSNKHVALVPGEVSFSMFPADVAGKPVLGQRVNFGYDNPDQLWVGHPSPEVDVAAMFLGPFLHAAQNAKQPVFFRAVHSSIMPSDTTVSELDANEPVTFVGYPNALYDKYNFTPILRRGHTATPPSLDYNGLPAFLIDASVFPGSSGSPVFIVNEGGYRQNGSFILGGVRVLFMGVLAAVHVQFDTGKILTRTEPCIAFQQMLDLGIVFNWRAMQETVEALFEAKGVKIGKGGEVPVDVGRVDVTREDTPPPRPETS